MGSSPALRARAVTSQGCRSSHPTWFKRQSNCYASSSRISAAWRSCTISAIPSPRQTDAVKAAAGRFGLDVATAEIRRAEDIAPAIEALEGRADALIVPSEPLYNTNRIQINSWALRAQLPTIYFDRVYVETGGLMSYGPNWPSLWHRAAEVVDKILRGAKPADIPVEQPRTFELVINLKTAKALGLTVPDQLLVAADEVIE